MQDGNGLMGGMDVICVICVVSLGTGRVPHPFHDWPESCNPACCKSWSGCGEYFPRISVKLMVAMPQLQFSTCTPSKLHIVTSVQFSPSANTAPQLRHCYGIVERCEDAVIVNGLLRR